MHLKTRTKKQKPKQQKSKYTKGPLDLNAVG
jgi:hypothetical protein